MGVVELTAQWAITKGVYSAEAAMAAMAAMATIILKSRPSDSISLCIQYPSAFHPPRTFVRTNTWPAR